MADHEGVKRPPGMSLRSRAEMPHADNDRRCTTPAHFAREVGGRASRRPGDRSRRRSWTRSGRTTQQSSSAPSRPTSARPELFGSRHRPRWALLERGQGHPRRLLRHGVAPAGDLGCPTSTLLDRYDQGVRQQVLVKIPKTVLGAVLLGFGTVFQPKARFDDHWSTSPEIVLEVHASAEDSSDPTKS